MDSWTWCTPTSQAFGPWNGIKILAAQRLLHTGRDQSQNLGPEKCPRSGPAAPSIYTVGLPGDLSWATVLHVVLVPSLLCVLGPHTPAHPSHTVTFSEAGGGEVEPQSLEASLGLMEWGHTQQCSQLTLALLTIDSGFILRVCSWLCMNLGTICRVGD